VNGEKIFTAMENRERRGKEETPLEDSKGSICECIYTSRTSKDFSYLILSYDEFALQAPSSRSFRSREPAAVRKCSTAPITQPSTVVHSTSDRLSRTVCLSYEIRPYLRSCLQISWKILSLALSTTQQSDTIHQNATPTFARPF